MPALDKLGVNDPRVEHLDVEIRGRNYHYMLAKPDSEILGTVLLVHGFPDLPLGWRYQVPLFLSLGYQVILPDLLGYGRSASPDSLEPFGMKSMSDDLAALTAHIVGDGNAILLGGHDWGGALVWRMAMYHPKLIRAVFSICTPYAPPRPVFIDLPDLVKHLPNFSYQLQLAGPDAEAGLQSEDAIRQFLKAILGGRGPNGEVGFTSEKGILFDNLPKIGDSKLVSHEYLDHYVAEFARSGFRGPLNWYRNRKVCFEEELPFAKDPPRFAMPALLVVASQDDALPPSMARGMGKHFESLTLKEIKTNHWAMLQDPVTVNNLIKEWLEAVSLLPKEAKAAL